MEDEGGTRTIFIDRKISVSDETQLWRSTMNAITRVVEPSVAERARRCVYVRANFLNELRLRVYIYICYIYASHYDSRYLTAP